MTCSQCKNKIKEDEDWQRHGISNVHSKCMKAFIEKHLKKVKKKPVIVKRKKKTKKKTRTWYRKKAIELAKKLAKERDGYKCQYCGKDRSQVQIHGSHVYSVGSKLYLACDLKNIKALCSYHHHRWWHSNIIEASEWFKNKFPDRYKYLQKRIRNYNGEKVDWESEYNKLKELDKTKKQ